MTDREQNTAHQRDIPEQRQRVAALLLKLTPVMFVFCYVLAAVQGAKWQHSLLIAVVGAAMCLGWAGFCKLRGVEIGGRSCLAQYPAASVHALSARGVEAGLSQRSRASTFFLMLANPIAASASMFTVCSSVGGFLRAGLRRVRVNVVRPSFSSQVY